MHRAAATQAVSSYPVCLGPEVEAGAGAGAQVNPLAGCLPTLATIPVFIGLYRALSNVAEEGLLKEGLLLDPLPGRPDHPRSPESGALPPEFQSAIYCASVGRGG